jgi:plasmid stabilization system protein ParE
MEWTRPLIWSPEAESDLEKILEYLEENWSESVIHNFLKELFEALDWIVDNPEVFMFSINSSNIRKFVLSKHHTIYFEIQEDQIGLLRIFDNRQNPDKIIRG